MYIVKNGKSYNTETATKLAERDSGHLPTDFYYWAEALYIKRTGEYFLHCEGGANSKYGRWVDNSGGPGEHIKILNLSEAKSWTEENFDGETYEKLFGGIEDSDETEQQQKFTVLLPAEMFEKLKSRKADTGATISAQIVKALRDAGY